MLAFYRTITPLAAMKLPCYIQLQQADEVPELTYDQGGKKTFLGRASRMATQYVGTKRACFLCILCRQACQGIELAGRIIAALERVIDGERTPALLIDTGTARVELRLQDQYYRSLVRELKARGNVIGTYELPLRVYHLPTPPTVVEYNGKPRLCYQGNAYTLAVVAPDILLNITDLNQAEYCTRQHLLNRLSPSAPSAATIRGNIVHYCFKELLKEHDRGRANALQVSIPNGLGKDIGPLRLPRREVHTPNPNESSENALDTLHRHLEQALQLNSLDMALANVSLDAMRADTMPHLESLAHWYENERATLWDMPTRDPAHSPHTEGNQVRAETFLLAPEIGLRGRLDLFWQQASRQRLLELKTGAATGDLPKREHRWQVLGYHALLIVRRDSQMKKALATLLYSGTPGHAQAIGIPATIREIQRVNEIRNILILEHVTGIPSAPPGPSRCTRCSMLNPCQQISSLLQWQAPEPEQHTAQQSTNETIANILRPRSVSTDEDRAFFAKYYRLLQLEGRAGEEQQAMLWKLSVAQRLERGTAIADLEPLDEPVVNKDGWEQTFRCPNTSELRDGDEILLSNDDPIAGEVVTGTILKISSEHVTVWTRELITHPTLLDRYDNDIVHVRTQQNLLRWLQSHAHLRDLVAGKVRPRFTERPFAGRSDFNMEQNLAVARALQMQDYLLIHGPPGTGKTSVIAEIVCRFCDQGQRVLLAAFTNQAIDNLLKRLDKEGCHDYLRLGHERSVDDHVKPRLLQTLVDAIADPTSVHSLLHLTPIVASTTATWSSDKYSPPPSQDAEHTLDDPGLHFDVAIIDEAGQLTVPAILGALRFAKKFILVGDEKQLPPLVLSKTAAEQGLAISLFSSLKVLNDEYIQKQPLTISACVSLRTQYRMNKWIANFSSTVFYEKQLLAHSSIANRKLMFPTTTNKQSISREAPTISRAIHPAFPLVFLDVQALTTQQASSMQSDGEAIAEQRADKRDTYTETKTSNEEAQAVRVLVAALLARGIAQRDIGIIAPYRAQVANIRRHLFTHDPSLPWQALAIDSPLSVDTVDRFQGGERSVIIMSFATSSEPQQQSQRREFLLNPHRLNVALTRAQCKLILVGCVPALENLPIFCRLITYCRSMNTVVGYGM
ncbi:MAG: hypothetical protein E6J34_14050 [Chloroflexi bacterium]|nr:MAG: hypothetical protein E6J34_14050 [Chloroflexota bacterium]